MPANSLGRHGVEAPRAAVRVRAGRHTGSEPAQPGREVGGGGGLVVTAGSYARTYAMGVSGTGPTHVVSGPFYFVDTRLVSCRSLAASRAAMPLISQGVWVRGRYSPRLHHRNYRESRHFLASSDHRYVRVF
jgi:hypothetical protein